MKKIVVAIFFLVCSQARASVWTVQVEDFQFSPSTLNVQVGDVIHWVWVGGFHTTTSLAVPPGAPTWIADIISASRTFDYTVTAVGTYNYQCDVHPGVMQGSFTASNVTPVLLSAFDISEIDNIVTLKWTTETELNADYFSVKKSLNGVNFIEIAKIPATGNSSTTQRYSVADKGISTNDRYVYYSVTIVDKDGKLQLSPIKIYKNKISHSRLILSLSPNPIDELAHLVLRFNADRPGHMLATLVDAQGKKILQTTLSANRGVNNGHIHLAHVPKGSYTFVFTLDDISESYIILKE